MKKNILISLLLCVVATLAAQPRYDMNNICREALDRGVVAIRQQGHVILSWRTLSTDAAGEAFDIFRNGTKLNVSPLTTGGTFFVDEHPASGDVVYEVRGGGKNGTFTLRADAPEGYLAFRLMAARSLIRLTMLR